MLIGHLRLSTHFSHVAKHLIPNIMLLNNMLLHYGARKFLAKCPIILGLPYNMNNTQAKKLFILPQWIVMQEFSGFHYWESMDLGLPCILRYCYHVAYGIHVGCSPGGQVFIETRYLTLGISGNVSLWPTPSPLRRIQRGHA